MTVVIYETRITRRYLAKRSRAELLDLHDQFADEPLDFMTRRTWLERPKDEVIQLVWDEIERRDDFNRMTDAELARDIEASEAEWSQLDLRQEEVAARIDELKREQLRRAGGPSP